jgi:hypothetical protein
MKCALCVAKGQPRYLRDKPVTAEINGVPVHDNIACKRDAESALRYWNERGAEVKNGAWRWKSNGSVPPAEITGMWVAFGFITETEHAASQAISEAETAEFLRRYRENPPPITDEARFEARAAHGPGVKLVNVITGQEWTT